MVSAIPGTWQVWMEGGPGTHSIQVGTSTQVPLSPGDGVMLEATASAVLTGAVVLTSHPSLDDFWSWSVEYVGSVNVALEESELRGPISPVLLKYPSCDAPEQPEVVQPAAPPY